MGVTQMGGQGNFADPRLDALIVLFVRTDLSVAVVAALSSWS